MVAVAWPRLPGMYRGFFGFSPSLQVPEWEDVAGDRRSTVPNGAHHGQQGQGRQECEEDRFEELEGKAAGEEVQKGRRRATGETQGHLELRTAPCRGPRSFSDRFM